MPTAIRFHLDESAPSAIALALRQRGIDVTTPAEVGLAGASDVDHAAFALSTGRAIVTQDVDFLVLHSNGTEHAGIIYCQQQSRTIGQIIRSLALIYELLSAEEIQGQLEFI